MADKAAIIRSFKGLISAPFTAFTPDGEVNVEIIPQYIDFLVSQGVKGAFVNGTTGEGISLSVKERKLIAEAWVKHGEKKLELIIIHIGANSLKDAQELASHAAKIGATGIAALPPLFFKPKSVDQLVYYYKELSKAAPQTPLMLYHIPSFSSVEICLSEFLPKVRKEVPNFIGAKFTSIDVRDLLKCHALKENFTIISGFEEVLLPCLACGGTAAIGAVYNFMAPLSLKVLEEYNKGNIEEARKYQNRVLEAVTMITRHGPGVACSKAAMKFLTGMDFGPPRAPVVPLDSKALSNLENDIAALKTDDWRI